MAVVKLFKVAVSLYGVEWGLNILHLPAGYQVEYPPWLVRPVFQQPLCHCEWELISE